MQPDPKKILSPQQTRLFALLSGGYLYTEIAAKMGLKKQTIKNYATDIRAKFGARTMVQAAVIAASMGLIITDDQGEPREVEFPCPRCGGPAFYYPLSRQAGCLTHGWLLYTEIPPEIVET